MSSGLDWKWIALGVVIMFGLSIVAGLIVSFFWAGDLEAIAEGGEPPALGGGQALLLAVINFLSFAIGGFIVGLKSAGRTILEPGISAAIAVALALLFTGSFGLFNLLAGALIPFVAGLLGGWLGERQQGTA